MPLLSHFIEASNFKGNSPLIPVDSRLHSHEELKIFSGHGRSRIRLHRMCSLIFDLQCPTRVYSHNNNKNNNNNNKLNGKIFHLPINIKNSFYLSNRPTLNPLPDDKNLILTKTECMRKRQI